MEVILEGAHHIVGIIYLINSWPNFATFASNDAICSSSTTSPRRYGYIFQVLAMLPIQPNMLALIVIVCLHIKECLSTLDFDGLFSNLSHVRSFCVLMQAASTDINCCFIWNLYTLACHNLSLIVNLHAQFYSLKSSTCPMWVMRG